MWLWLAWAARLVIVIVGWLCIGSSHLLATLEPELSEDSTEEEVLYDINGLESIGNFFMRYVLTLILLQLAEMDSSFIIGIFYSLAAILIYYRALIYTTVTITDEIKLIVTAVVFLLGMRISLLS